MKDSQYVVCKYLTKLQETRGYIKYKKLTRDVFVLPGEGMCPFVNIDKDFCLAREEKQWLDDCA